MILSVSQFIWDSFFLFMNFYSAVFQESRRLHSGLMIYEKNSDISKAVYSWMQFITVKGCRLKSAKDA